MASVLMINLPPEKRNLLQVLSIRMNFSCRDVLPREQQNTLFDLLYGLSPAKQNSKSFHDEMLIMDGFPHQDLNFLLNELIRTGNPIRLKAVTTPTNIRWTVAALHAQLVMENAEMKRHSPEASL